jgi:hypothetical protein
LCRARPTLSVVNNKVMDEDGNVWVPSNEINWSQHV